MICRLYRSINNDEELFVPVGIIKASPWLINDSENIPMKQIVEIEANNWEEALDLYKNNYQFKDINQ